MFQDWDRLTDGSHLCIQTLISLIYGELNYSDCIPQFASPLPALRSTAGGHMSLSHAIMSHCAFFFLLCLFCLVLCLLQPSSTLSSYVSACAYSPSNQYGVYSGPAGGYVAQGHHHWQPQSPAMSHPGGGGGMSMHAAGDIHSSMTFKHQAREGTEHREHSLIWKLVTRVQKKKSLWGAVAL